MSLAHSKYSINDGYNTDSYFPLNSPSFLNRKFFCDFCFACLQKLNLNLKDQICFHGGFQKNWMHYVLSNDNILGINVDLPT